MYYRNMEAHGAYPGLPTVEAAIIKSVAEAPSERTPSAEMQDQLDNMRGADPSIGESPSVDTSERALDSQIEDMIAGMSPEARENAESIFSEMGAPAVASEVVVVTPEEEATAVATIDQAEAYANDPANHVSTETNPRKLGADEVSAVNESLKNFSANGEASVTVTSNMSEQPVAPSAHGERPISGRRVSVEKPVAVNDADAALVAKLTNGRLNRMANRIEGTRELRADRKHIISKQKEAMDTAVFDARGAKWNARGNRLGTVAKNNVIARTFGNRAQDRVDRKVEIRGKAFDAIAEARRIKNEKRNRDPDATSTTDKLRRAGVRMKSWNVARKEIRDSSRKAMETARGTVIRTKSELEDKKDKRSSLNFRPYRRRTTLAGESASLRSAFTGAGEQLGMTEEQKQAQAKKRAEVFAKRQKEQLAKRNIDARKRWESRPVSKQKANRVIVQGPHRSETGNL